MRGIIFTEFVTFLEEQIGLDAVERAIAQTSLRSGGAYTSVGSYPYAELEALLGTVVKLHTTVDAMQALYDFGYWLAARFESAYGDFFTPHDNAIDFLASIDDHIHVEVRKLNPDAVPPRITVEPLGDGSYRLSYQSHRPLARLALGLTEGALAAYGAAWTTTDYRAGADDKTMTLNLVEVKR